MGNLIIKFETSESTCPAALSAAEIASIFPTFWAIGNLDILDTNLLGIFCSIRCPGNIILNTYDCMRIPGMWKKPVDDGRLLIMSPFGGKQKRPTVASAQKRNYLVAKLSRSDFIPYADAGSKTDQLGRYILDSGKKVYTFDSAGGSLTGAGAKEIGPGAENVPSLFR